MMKTILFLCSLVYWFGEIGHVWGAASRPNVLFLAVDDLRDWVGCLEGYAGTVHTPNIDRLARRGVLFSNAHCPSPKCAPSRAAIMTGLMPSTTGLYDNGHWWYPNLPDVITLPAHFLRNGYRVHGAGKIFHHTAGNHPPNQWEVFAPIRFHDDPWFRESRLNYPWTEAQPFPDGFPFSGLPGLPHENDWGAIPVQEGDYDDERSVAFAIRFLASVQDERPFFLACGLFRPHLPWYVPQRFFDLYPLDEIRLPDVRADDLTDVPAGGRELAIARSRDWKRIRSAGKWRSAVRAYLASITFADEQVGRVLQALRQHGLAARTVVVLWSDHGWHLGEKGHWHKSTLWEVATRVPLLVSIPGGRVGRTDVPVSLVDLFPTLNELCELPPVEGLDGVSLVPLLEDPAAKIDRVAVTEFRKGNASVRSDRYRYIRYREGGEELYDHRRDPNEWRNLMKEPGGRDVANRLARQMPEKWASAAATKTAFRFDPDQFSWTEKATGRVIRGR